jgi:hypothetical protein
MPGAIAGNPPRDDFAPFVDKAAQQPLVPVIDVLYLILAKIAEFPTPQFRHCLASILHLLKIQVSCGLKGGGRY